MSKIHTIKEWLEKERKKETSNLLMYLIVFIGGLLISFSIIYSLNNNFEETMSFFISGKSGLAISLTATIGLLSSLIKSNDLRDKRKSFLKEFGNTRHDMRKEINEQILKIVEDNLENKKEN